MTVDPHELPPELAAQLLEKQDKHTRGPLPPATEEILKILAEECGETVQRVTKILRFGFRKNPWNDKDNREQLEARFDATSFRPRVNVMMVVDGMRYGVSVSVS